MSDKPWLIKPVSEIADIFLGGTPSRNKSDYWGGEILWASAKDIASSKERYIYEASETISQEGLENSAAKLLPRNTVVITARGTVGAIRMLGKPMSFNQTCYGLIPRQDVDPSFLFYSLKGSIDQISSLSYGTVFNTITTKTFDSILIAVPPLQEQRDIIEILGSLDDKIELNRRMNDTLESIAQAMFRQRFINGVDKDWIIGKLGDIAQNIRQSIDAEDIDSDTNYIGLEHMPRGSIALSEWGKARGLESNKYIFKEGEFLFGKLRPYFRKVGIAPIDGVCSTDILVIAPILPEWYGFVLGQISSVELINFTNAASTGTKMPRTNWSDIANHEISIPPIKLANEYNALFLPIAQLIRSNIFQSRILASLRDSLMPKLMNGDIQAKDMEG